MKIQRKKKIALTEILIMTLSVVAFSYLIASSLPEVSGVIDPTGGPAINIPKPPVGFEPPPKLSLFPKLFGQKYAALHFSVFVAGAIIAISFISTLIKTGSVARATDVALRMGIGAGVGAGVGAGIIELIGTISAASGPGGWIIGGLILLGVFLSSLLRREQDRQISFTCNPWQASIGGANCEKCNNRLFPCTEYQCRTFGKGCELINANTDDPRCIWKNARDINPPQINPRGESLSEGYQYEPLPRGRYGVEIIYEEEKCLPAFQPFSFGVELDKEGYCKIDFEKKADFSEMRFDFGGRNTYHINHTQYFTFPGIEHLRKEIEENSLNITIDSNLELYVRCESVNGKSNRDAFLFKFCIDEGPDTTSPEIRGFNYLDQTPIAYFAENEKREVDVQVYINEPGTCRWDWEDKKYGDMQNILLCSDKIINYNAQLTYTCSGKLTGLQNDKENIFFFRCNDTSGNVNGQSKTLTLIGTQPLYISKLSPDKITIKDSTNVVKVKLEAETSAGYDKGTATCSYKSSTENSGRYIVFSDTDSHQHTTDVRLSEGSYKYFIRCMDTAGNSDTKEINFTIETDTQAPIVVRVLRDLNNLKVITNEESSCVFDTTNCQYDFENGINMIGSANGKEHSTEWKSDRTFYIKCKDDFGNKPTPDTCSIIVKPFDI